MLNPVPVAVPRHCHSHASFLTVMGQGLLILIGPDIVPDRIGERVWIWNAAWMRPFGTAAQYVVLPSNQAVPLPDNVDLAVGACLGIPALTAYHAVTMDGGVANKNVLVTGGAGAVGHYAIQLAKLKGAQQVITTVSGPEKASLAREAGADIVLNYKTDDLLIGYSTMPQQGRALIALLKSILPPMSIKISRFYDPREK